MQHSALYTIAILIAAIVGLVFQPNNDLKLETLAGEVIMGKMANQTARQELGRAFWTVFHTMAAAYPEKPTKDEAIAMRNWIYLTARLYPCAECAHHFQLMMKKNPPVVGSSKSLKPWVCKIHNLVNAHLEKEQFDCSLENLDARWTCGCAG